MFSVLRRISILMTMYGEIYFLGYFIFLILINKKYVLQLLKYLIFNLKQKKAIYNKILYIFDGVWCISGSIVTQFYIIY